MQGYNSVKSIQGIYDFDSDGGDVGTIQLGQFIPVNAIIVYAFANTIIDLDSDNDTTIEFGWTGETDSLLANTDFDGFAVNEVLRGRDFNSDPIRTVADRELAITIDDEPLTQGRILFNVLFITQDQ